MDIESFEHEAITGSVGWMSIHRPRIFLELHCGMLVARGVDPGSLLETLERIGYRWRGRGDLFKRVRSRLPHSGIIHLALAPPC